MQRVQPGIISPHWRIRRYTDFCPVSTEQLYGGQIRTVTAPNGAKLYQAEYDVWGRPDSETDGNGNTTVYEKDRWGHVTKG